MKKLLIRVLKVLTIAIFILSVVIFCKISNEFRERPLILDILKEYDTEYLNGSKYTLTIVSLGFHDKVTFVKLYKGDIKYDKHGNQSYDNVIFDAYIYIFRNRGKAKKNQ